MSHQVFICHSTIDKAVADGACAALEAAGIRCWIAPRDIDGGREWGTAIIDALGECRVVVLIFSAHADASPQVRREIERAVSKRKFIVPFRLENALPTGAMEYALSTTQWLDAIIPPAEQHFNALTRSVASLLESQAAALPEYPGRWTQSDGSALPPAGRRRILLLALLAIVLCSASYFLVSHIWRRAHQAPSAHTPFAAVPAHAPSFVLLRTLQGHSYIVMAVAFSPDGLTLASGGADNVVKLWNPDNGQMLATLQTDAKVNTLAFSSDGRTLASAGVDNSVTLWNISSGQKLRTLRGHSAAVLSVAFSPDGRMLASGSIDHTIRLWDAATGRLLRTLLGHTEKVEAVSFSPDGRALASGSDDHTVAIWDSTSGRKLLAWQAHSGTVESIAFTPDGKSLASGSGDNTVKLWDAATGRDLLTLQGHTGAVEYVTFTPDGKTFASASDDHSIKLWAVSSGQLIQTLQGHLGSVNALAFSPDGLTLASGSDDHTVKLWDLTH